LQKRLNSKSIQQGIERGGFRTRFPYLARFSEHQRSNILSRLILLAFTKSNFIIFTDATRYGNMKKLADGGLINKPSASFKIFDLA